MKFVSLFAGIGGIDLGLERAGHTCVGQVEIDPYATRVLARHWPDTPRISDVRDFHGTEFGDFDLLTGGYPCQPFSHAGKRAGEHDPRHLWPEVHRLIRNVRPAFVLLENVPGHLSLGFGRVLGDLAESGYDAEWDCIPASAVGAPHRRDRLWIIAYTDRDAGQGRADASVAGRGWWAGSAERADVRRERESRADHAGPRGAVLAHPDNAGRPQQRGTSANASQLATAERCCARLADSEGQREWAGLRASEPAEQRRRRLGDSRSARHTWATEPDVGRVAHGIPARAHRLRALGNAVVPQVAELIGRRLPA